MSILFFNLNFSVFSSLRLSFAELFVALHNQLHGNGSGFKWNELKNKASRTALHKAHNNEWEENKAHCSTPNRAVRRHRLLRLYRHDSMHSCSQFRIWRQFVYFLGARYGSPAPHLSKANENWIIKWNTVPDAVWQQRPFVPFTTRIYMHRSIGSFNLPSYTSNAINFWCKHFIAEAHSIQTHGTLTQSHRVSVCVCIDTSGSEK